MKFSQTIALVLIVLLVSVNATNHRLHNTKRNRMHQQHKKPLGKNQKQHHHHMNMQVRMNPNGESVLEVGSQFNYEGNSLQDLAGDSNLLSNLAGKAYDTFLSYGMFSNWELYDLMQYNYGWSGLAPPGLDNLLNMVDEKMNGNYELSKDQYIEIFAEFVEQVSQAPESEMFYQDYSCSDIKNDESLKQEFGQKCYQTFSYDGFFDYYFAYEFGLYHSGWAQIEIKSLLAFAEEVDNFYDDNMDYNIDQEEFVDFYEDFLSSCAMGE